MQDDQDKTLLAKASVNNNTNNKSELYHHHSGDDTTPTMTTMNTRTSIPWYNKTRTRQIFAVLGVLVFVGVLLILIFVYKDMNNNNDNGNNNNNNIDPLVATAGVIPCEHPVYCSGDLLNEVQMNQIYSDNMHFVDLPIRYGVQSVLANFSALMQQKASTNPTTSQWKQMLVDFISEQFLVNTTDIQDAGVPADFNALFPGDSSITDAHLKTFAQDVHTKWKGLYRSFNLSSFCANCSSALELPFPFIVPGGRFSSTFYWDSYWIVQGLITSGMLSTARKMILNLLSLVSRLGYVPNGSRIYLADRSQPPLLTQMVAEYVAASGGDDNSLILIALPTLDKEYQFWDKYRRAPLKNYDADGQESTKYLLSRFYSVLKTPRPEGYSIDVGIKANAPSWNQESIYSNLRAGAETGWDFSSRWFKDRATISACDTSNVVPVDLNAILLKNEQLLESWFANDASGTSFSAADAAAKAAFYGQQWRKRQQSMLDLMWSNSSAAFRDIAVDRNDQFVPNVPLERQFALYGGATSAALSVQSIADVIRHGYGKQDDAVNVITHALIGVGGVGASNVSNTGQQWDGVDEWAPVVWFTQQAFAALGNQNAAQNLVQTWITQTYCGYNWTGVVDGQVMSKEMWEKYNSSAIGAPGNGGEYTVQTGFGWTNGLTLKWLKEFGNSGWLNAPNQC